MAKDSQFTYDFGIAVAQSTVNKVAKLAGVSLTLAGAFYALRNESSRYVNTLREQTLRFGGMLRTTRAIEQAQGRIVKGMSYFKMEDQLAGMNRLMSVGVDVGKNLEWINKAAHATGKSYEEFSNMIASSINGNASALVEAGLMTERSARMFDKYTAGTVQRQQAILSFLKTHKGLNNAMANDFETAKDQVTRLKGIWSTFVQKIAGDPRDPGSLMGSLNTSLKRIADMLGRNFGEIKKYAYAIGQVMGWFVRKVGGAVMWTLRKVGNMFRRFLRLGENYKEQVRNFIVYLEFWKVKVVDVMRKVFFNNEGRLRKFFKFVIGGMVAMFAVRMVTNFVNAIIGSRGLIFALKGIRGALTALSRLNLGGSLLLVGLGEAFHYINEMYDKSKKLDEYVKKNTEDIVNNPETNERYGKEAAEYYNSGELERKRDEELRRNEELFGGGLIGEIRERNINKRYENAVYPVYTDKQRERLREFEEWRKNGTVPSGMEDIASPSFIRKFLPAFLGGVSSGEQEVNKAIMAETKQILAAAYDLGKRYKDNPYNKESPSSDSSTYRVSSSKKASPSPKSTSTASDDFDFDAYIGKTASGTNTPMNEAERWLSENTDESQTTNVSVSPGAVTINLYEQQNPKDTVKLIKDTITNMGRDAVVRKGAVR